MSDPELDSANVEDQGDDAGPIWIVSSLHKAAEHQHAGHWTEAGELYKQILEVQPDNKEANFGMAGVAVALNVPELGLAHFEAALAVDPENPAYWIAYVDAMLLAGKPGEAGEVLTYACSQGLSGPEVAALERRLGRGQKPVAGPAKGIPKRKPATGKGNRRVGDREIDRLVAAFSAGKYPDALALAQAFTRKYPGNEFGWKAMGAVFQQLGRAEEAIAPLRRSIELSPNDVEATFNLGVVLQGLGRLDEAEHCYQNVLRVNPSYADALGNLGVLLHGAGRFSEAEAALRKAVAIKPGYAKAHGNLGMTLLAQAKFVDAAASLVRSTELDPGNFETLNQLGVALRRQGMYPDAEASIRRALSLRPDSADALNNLGIVLQNSERLDEAEASYRRAIELNPRLTEAYSNLGQLLQSRARPAEAEDLFRRGLASTSGSADLYCNLGTTLLALDRDDEAEACFRKALELAPGFVQAKFNLGVICRKMDKQDEAIDCFRQVCALDQSHVEAHVNWGNALQDQGKSDEALVVYRMAVQKCPESYEANLNLGLALQELGQFVLAESSLRKANQLRPDDVAGLGALGQVLLDRKLPKEAEEFLRQALKLDPDDSVTQFRLGNSLMRQFKLEEAIHYYRVALKLAPDASEIWTNMLFAMSRSHDFDGEALACEHRRYGESIEPVLREHRVTHRNLKDPGRRLNIGFVSADFRKHSVAFFIEALFSELLNHPGLCLHGFNNTKDEDEVTERLKQQMHRWHGIHGLENKQVVEIITDANIDILVDLSGHTDGNRMSVFACKPAPIQVSWIGYPGTTGLKAMDYYLTDKYFLPAEEFCAQYTEKLVYLPACVNFQPEPSAPPVSMLPALHSGQLTLGSFNSPSKISRPVIALWAELLRALPRSRFLLAGLSNEAKAGQALDWFDAEGIVPDRIIQEPRSALGHYLQLHHQVDFCVDTFPYNGGTTTLHALWMGVPTLTLSKGTPASRAGASLLSHVGLEQFIAKDETEFIQKGLYWANNLEELQTIRAGLRRRFSSSALGQPALLAASLNRAFRTMWHRWCEDLPAESFDASTPEVVDPALFSQLSQ